MKVIGISCVYFIPHIEPFILVVISSCGSSSSENITYWKTASITTGDLTTCSLTVCPLSDEICSVRFYCLNLTYMMLYIFLNVDDDPTYFENHFF